MMRYFRQSRFLPISTLIFIGLLIAIPPVAAESNIDALRHGPKVGTSMRIALDDVTNQQGNHLNWQTLRGENGLILLFSRSFDW